MKYYFQVSSATRSNFQGIYFCHCEHKTSENVAKSQKTVLPQCGTTQRKLTLSRISSSKVLSKWLGVGQNYIFEGREDGQRWDEGRVEET